MTWPLVDKKDDGIRPAGRADACFYCGQKVGQPHGPKCVCVTKIVLVNVTLTGIAVFDLQITTPHIWNKSTLEFHRNDSSWCAGNVDCDIMEHRELTNDPSALADVMAKIEAWKSENDNYCLCGIYTCEFLRVVDNTPTRKVRR